MIHCPKLHLKLCKLVTLLGYSVLIKYLINGGIYVRITAIIIFLVALLCMGCYLSQLRLSKVHT